MGIESGQWRTTSHGMRFNYILIIAILLKIANMIFILLAAYGVCDSAKFYEISENESFSS